MELLAKHFELALETPDGIKKLRELILTLAMQGKLVPQDPNDQPASELLKEIQAVRERLINDEGLRTIASQSISNDEKYIKTPDGWEFVRLGNIAKFIDYRGRTPVKVKKGIPLITAKNIRFGYIDRAPYEYISEKDYEGWMTRGIPRVGDLLFTTEAPLGNIAVINIKEKFGLAQRAICFQLHNSEMANFLCYLVMSNIFQEQLLLNATGMTAKGIKASRLKEMPIPLPPLAEQKRIVVRIDQLKALCDKLELQRNNRDELHRTLHTAAINGLLSAKDTASFNKSWNFMARNFDRLYTTKHNVAELRKAILQLAVMGKLVKQDTNDQPACELLKEIQAEKERLVREGRIKKQKELPPIKPEEVLYAVPDGWSWTRLGEICTYIQRGKGPKYADFSKYRVISQKCVRWYGLDTEPARYIEDSSIDEYEEIRFLKTNDLLWNSTGTGTIGRACLFPNNLKNQKWVVDSHVTIVRAISIESAYLWRFIQSPIIQDEIENSASGTTNQIELNTSTVINQLFPLPPLAEQKRIVAKIDKLMVLCDKLEEQIEQGTVKQSALFDAVLAAV